MVRAKADFWARQFLHACIHNSGDYLHKPGPVNTLPGKGKRLMGPYPP